MQPLLNDCAIEKFEFSKRVCSANQLIAIIRAEFKGNPEYAPPKVFYNISLRNYASFSLPDPSTLSILLVCLLPLPSSRT